MKLRLISVALVFITPNVFISTSFAETLVEFGIHSGGDEITLVSESNTVIESTKAGSKYSFSIGGTKAFTDNYEAQFSFGIKSDASYSTDNESSWVRYPLNAMLFYHSEDLRLGLGTTAHLFAKFKASGTTNNASTTYKDAIGALFEIDYRLDRQYYLGLRYTSIKYVSEDNGNSYDGSSVGILIIVLI